MSERKAPDSYGTANPDQPLMGRALHLALVCLIGASFIGYLVGVRTPHLAEEVIKPHFNADLRRKTVILLKGEELCRARGGPRCLTHPLLREKF